MSRDVTNITLDALDELPKQCRKCVFWELAPHLGEQAAEYGSIELEKEAWVSGVLLEWGSCGKFARVDGLPAGYVMYAPPGAVPRAADLHERAGERGRCPAHRAAGDARLRAHRSRPDAGARRSSRTSPGAG